MGGGVCIFSRYPIVETMYFNFPLNGHAHKLLHGDWYGSKGCGLAVLKVKDLTVNVYATHVSLNLLSIPLKAVLTHINGHLRTLAIRFM